MKNLSFEDKIKKSKEILDKLMDPEITLENSVKFYKEGLTELQEAQKLLEDRAKKVQKVESDSLEIEMRI